MCAWQESNLRPSGPQPDALSTELQAQNIYFFINNKVHLNM